MRRFIAALLLTGLGRAALAQQPADTLRLTLDGAVQRALERGVELRLARADVLEANGAVREALSAALPQVTGSLTYSRQFASIYQGVAADTSSIAKLFQNTPFGAPNTCSGGCSRSRSRIWIRLGSICARSNCFARLARAPNTTSSARRWRRRTRSPRSYRRAMSTTSPCSS